jgi:nicotinate-nucleotide adenylyltransferase
MDRARQRAHPRLTLTGLLGGSFNPAHRGHRHISLAAAQKLELDAVWWLVSPGNPLKSGKDMAPYPARMASAQRAARRSIITACDIEARIGTRYTIDTIRALKKRYPKRRFVWIIGADIIGEFHRWRDWRQIARLVPIAIVARPGYEALTVATPATVWLQRFVRRTGQAKNWTHWKLPAIVTLHVRPDPTSATAIRRADPQWYRRFERLSSNPRRHARRTQS